MSSNWTSSMANEIWKPVPGFEDRYEVSSEGRVLSWFCPGTGGKRATPRLLTPAANYAGYQVVSLNANGRAKQFRVARLVLLAHRGEPQHGETASHLNGDRSDNRLDNLAWESVSQNILRKHEHGTGRNQWGPWIARTSA